MSHQSTYITVTELTSSIKGQLETHFSQVTVQGEMTNIKLHSSGHLYFDLKDAGAKIAAVMFRASCALLKKPPKEGDLVVVKGAVSVYAPHGKYQLTVRSLEYLGLGELLMKLEELKKKLHSLGWFDAEKKKALPKFPITIGVVTSPTGAVIRDIIHILRRRSPGFHLILNPVRVQGAEAPQEIAEAIKQFNQHKLADVLIVGRGGGSLEDLWAFNDERVAQAIFESQIPIISAVGHETDVTLSDFVADLRAPTPSAAAEIVSAESARLQEFLIKAKKTLNLTLSYQLRNVRMQWQGFARHPLFATSYHLLGSSLQRIDEIKSKLEGRMKENLYKARSQIASYQSKVAPLQPSAQLTLYQTKLEQIDSRLLSQLKQMLQMKKMSTQEIVKRLSALDPKNVLKRGYAILFAEKDGSVIVSSRSLHPGLGVEALLSDGKVKLNVADHP